MKKITNQLRQGDVLIVPVANLPDGVKKAKHEAQIILAHGEATGHHHSIYAKRGQVRRHTSGEEVYLEVISPVSLEHQEHASLVLQPGIYQVRKQVEVWHEEIRRVMD